MDFEEEKGLYESEGFVDRVGGFLDANQWIIFLIFFVSLVLFLLAVFLPEPSIESPLGTMYNFNYGPVLIYKSVSNENSRHTEKIIVSSASGARDLSLFVLVPKELAQSSADVVLASNGRISILQPDPLYKIDAVNADSISLEISTGIKGAEENHCSFLVVMHSAVVSQFSQEEMQSVVESIISKDVAGFDCDAANNAEKDLGSRLYKAATEE